MCAIFFLNLFLKINFFFKSLLFKNIFFSLKSCSLNFPSSKPDASYIFWIQNLTRCIFSQSIIWRVVKFSNQNRTRCENFVSKSDALEIFVSKSDTLKNFDSKSVKIEIFLRKLNFFLFFRFWLIDDIFCERYYQIILKRRMERQCLL